MEGEFTKARAIATRWPLSLPAGKFAGHVQHPLAQIHSGERAFRHGDAFLGGCAIGRSAVVRRYAMP